MVEPVREQIRRLVGIAESSTQDLSDAETRRVAFQVVLSHLLERAGSPDEKHASQAGRPSHAAPRSTTQRTRGGPSNWVLKLIEEGFFSKPRLIGDVVTRLGEVGHTVLSKDVSYPLARFCELRRLRRTKSGKDARGRVVWSYTNY